MFTEQMIETSGGAHLHVRSMGGGPPVLVIPSLGRGVEDFSELAHRLADAGFLTILPEPRGIGRSMGPPPDDLFDLAGDVTAVIEAMGTGPVQIIGHAFGNRVARATAALSPSLVRSVALLAGGGEIAPAPEISAAVRGAVSEGVKPDAERLKDIDLAFFAAGGDARVWLHGWHAKAAQAQTMAGRATEVSRWWTAGEAPVLFVQAKEDPVAPPGNAAALARDIGARLSLITLAHASHAILPEQPVAVAALLTLWLRGERDARILQAAADGATRVPGAKS